MNRERWKGRNDDEKVPKVGGCELTEKGKSVSRRTNLEESKDDF